jgi:FHA domain
MTYACRAGHDSDESDYCSVCGAAIATAQPPRPFVGAPGRNTPLPSSVRAALPGTCPSCGEPRLEPDARFCEVCRYDFVAKTGGPPPIGASTPKTTPQPLAPRAAAWEITLAVDPSLDTEPDPDAPCPKDAPVQTVALDRAEMLIGRHDDRRDIHPELPIRDPGASRRHAKLIVTPEGLVALQDLASTNGTKINGKEVPSGARVTLAAGDEITLGRWTRIKVRSAKP